MNDEPRHDNLESEEQAGPTGPRQWARPFLWIESQMERFDRLLGRLAIFQVLDKLGRLAIVFAVVFYWLDADDRSRNAHRAAWLVINSAQTQKGSGGRIDALEFLNAEGVSLSGLSAPGAHLTGINLEWESLVKADFSRANLAFAHLRHADLSRARAYLADLSNAVLIGADLRDASLYGADITDAKLGATNFRNAKNLSFLAIKSAKDWKNACYDGAVRAALGIETENPKCVQIWGEP